MWYPRMKLVDMVLLGNRLRGRSRSRRRRRTVRRASERTLSTKQHGGDNNPEMDRAFHLTVANDQGGDPMGSVSAPPRHS